MQLAEFKLTVCKIQSHFDTEVKEGLSPWPAQHRGFLPTVHLLGRGGLKKQMGEKRDAHSEFLPFELILVDLFEQWLRNFLIQFAPIYPLVSMACYFLMKPFSQPLVFGIKNKRERGYYFLFLIRILFFSSLLQVLILLLHSIFQKSVFCSKQQHKPIKNRNIPREL